MREPSAAGLALIVKTIWTQQALFARITPMNQTRGM
jgi:hypothetical protein